MHTPNEHEQALTELWECARVLRALGGLLEQQITNPDYSNGQLLGLGHLLNSMAMDLFEVEERLRN